MVRSMEALSRGLGTLLILAAISGSAFSQQAEIPASNREADADYQEARLQWIRQMHRAEPGVNTDVIDAESRDAKFRAAEYLRSRKGHLPLGITSDTLAGGNLIGKWSERGSNNISGRMITADIDFDNNTIYAASAMGNIWKADLGNSSSWRSLNDTKRLGGVQMLRTVTTSKGKRLIAACNGPTAVYTSDDDGLTWQTASGLDGPKSWGGFRRAVMDAKQQNIYLFGNEWNYDAADWRAVSTLYRSTDQGKTFKNLGKWRDNTDQCDIWVSRDTISPVFFLRSDSLYTIGAGGAISFLHRMNFTDSIGKIGSLILQGAIAKKTVNLAVLETTSGVGTITASSDGGLNWKKTGKFMGSPFSINSFKISQVDPQTMAIGTIETFISRSGGDSASWQHTNGWGEYYGNMAERLHADIDGIDFIRDPLGNEACFVSTDGGLFSSQDGMNTFNNLTLNGIGTGQFYSTLTSSQPPYYIYAGSQDQGYQRGQDTIAGTIGMTQTISGDYGHLSSSNRGKSVWCDYPGFAMLYTNAEGGGRNPGWDFRGKNHLWLPPMISDPLDSSAAYIACGGDADESFIWHIKNVHLKDRD
ncbi:MAG: hypothetical protein ABI778_01500, partial [Ignavibacteriota bacterium]